MRDLRLGGAGGTADSNAAWREHHPACTVVLGAGSRLPISGAYSRRSPAASTTTIATIPPPPPQKKRTPPPPPPPPLPPGGVRPASTIPGRSCRRLNVRTELLLYWPTRPRPRPPATPDSPPSACSALLRERKYAGAPQDARPTSISNRRQQPRFSRSAGLTPPAT